MSSPSEGSSSTVHQEALPPGPVPSLEAHLRSDWWRTLFTETYLLTDGDIVENDANTRADVDQILEIVAPAKAAPIIDLCCGQGRHLLELWRRGFTSLTGVDQAPALIDLAIARARSRGADVRFIEGDVRSAQIASRAFDVALMLGNAFGYMHTEADDLNVLRVARGALSEGGAFVIDVSDGDWVRSSFAPRSWEWLEDGHVACRERELTADGSRVVCREVVLSLRQGLVKDQVYAERLYTRASLASALERAGFSRVDVLPAPTTDSSRGQDLGTMAHRIWAVARC